MSDLGDSVFRSLQIALMTSSPELTYEDGMKVLEAIRILHEAAVDQDRRLEELAEAIQENNELQKQLIQALVGETSAETDA